MEGMLQSLENRKESIIFSTLFILNVHLSSLSQIYVFILELYITLIHQLDMPLYFREKYIYLRSIFPNDISTFDPYSLK